MMKNNTFIGWLSLALIVIASFIYLNTLNIKDSTLYFAIVVGITLVLWIFNLVNDFIPSLLAMLMILLLGLAPAETVLSGFSSQSFLLAFSVLGLGAVISQSGLTKRYTLWILQKLPAHSFAHQMLVFMTGNVFNPIIPTITGRAVIVAPVMNQMVKDWDNATKQGSSTAIYTAGLDSVAYLSPIFLTAAPANLMIFGLMSAQDQFVYDYVFWLYAASVTGLIMLVLYFVLAGIYFRNFRRISLDKQRIAEEYQKLGHFNWRERTSLVAIVALGVAIATTGIHKIPVAYLAFFILVSLLMLGALSRDEFVQKIDWAFLFMLAGIIGILGTMRHLGLDDQLMHHLRWLGDYMRDDFGLFVLYLSSAVLLVRLIIPLNSAILIFAAALLPIAEAVGVSAWLVGFIILIMAETAFFGYQSPYILAFRRMVEGTISYQERQVQIFHLLLIPVKLLAIYASIPFWQQIGVL